MAAIPALNRELIDGTGFASGAGVSLPTAQMLDLPERAVQFGTGGFLRGFVEYFIDSANRAGVFNGRIVAVSTTGSGRDAKLDTQNGLYTLAIQGVVNGAAVRDYRIISSLSRSLSATTSWADVLKLAENPDIAVVFSNTTEVGIVLDDDDRETLEPPQSFPGKLTAFLHRRATHFDFDRDKAVTVIPCELIENNGDQLKEIVGELSRRWGLGEEFSGWLESVAFCNTLVDRIVSGTPPAEQLDEMAESLGYADRLLTVCEPYRLFAIEAESQTGDALAWVRADDGIIVAETVAPYRERKVRLLNGAHTILVPLALLAGRETVFDAVEDSIVGQYLRLVMHDEIVPSLDVPQAEEFAAQVIERFRNPFIEHDLFGITLHGTTKMAVRVVPSIVQYAERTGKTPSSLAFGFAAYLLFMRGDLHEERHSNGSAVPTDDAGERVTAAWQAINANNGETDGLADLVEQICGDETLWRTDLRDVHGFADEVTTYLKSMVSAGVPAALAEFLGTEASVTGTST